MLAFCHTFAFRVTSESYLVPSSLRSHALGDAEGVACGVRFNRLWAGGRFLFAEAADKREGSTRMLRLFLIPEFASPFLGRPEVPVNLSPGGIRVVRVLDACARPLRRRWARARAPGSPTLL